MSDPENAGEVPENRPVPPTEPQPEEPDLGPEVDEDFPTYANEANKELNRKVIDVTINLKQKRYKRKGSN